MAGKDGGRRDDEGDKARTNGSERPLSFVSRPVPGPLDLFHFEEEAGVGWVGATAGKDGHRDGARTSGREQPLTFVPRPVPSLGP